MFVFIKKISNKNNTAKHLKNTDRERKKIEISIFWIDQWKIHIGGVH